MKKRAHKVSLLRVAWILLLMMPLSTGVLSKFVTHSQSADLSRVAKFVFDASLKQESAVVRFDSMNQQIRKPGDSVDFQLEVTNQREASVSEVSEKYEITISIDGSMPLTCTLLQDGTSKMVWSNTENVILGSPAASTYSSILAPGTGAADQYILNVKWPENQNSRKYANGSAAGELTITFTSTQVD